MMPVIFALLILPLIATGLSAWNQQPRFNHRITLAAGAAHLIASIYCLITRHNPFAAGSWLAVDALGAFFLVILSHTFVLVTLHAPQFLRCMEGAEYDRSKRL